MEDADEQAGGRDVESKLHGQGHGASVLSPPVLLPHLHLLTKLEALRTPVTGILGKFSYLGMINYKFLFYLSLPGE